MRSVVRHSKAQSLLGTMKPCYCCVCFSRIGGHLLISELWLRGSPRCYRNAKVINPVTKKWSCSYVEAVSIEIEKQKPTWFVSHWWGEAILDFVKCVTLPIWKFTFTVRLHAIPTLAEVADRRACSTELTYHNFSPPDPMHLSLHDMLLFRSLKVHMNRLTTAFCEGKHQLSSELMLLTSLTPVHVLISSCILLGEETRGSQRTFRHHDGLKRLFQV